MFGVYSWDYMLMFGVYSWDYMLMFGSSRGLYVDVWYLAGTICWCLVSIAGIIS